MALNLQLSDEQQLFSDALSRLLESHGSFERRRERVAVKAWGDPKLFAGLAELGCFLLLVDEAHGGLDANAIEAGLLARAVGRHILIEPVAETVVAGALLTGAGGGGDRLERVMAGTSRFGIAFADRDTPLRDVRGGWQADGILLAAPDGLYVGDADALRITPVRMLDDVVAVDVEGHADSWQRIDAGTDWALRRARAAMLLQLMLLNETVGVIDAALAVTIDHVRERQQFGKRLGDFQSVQHRVAEMLVASREAEAIVLLATLTFDAEGPGPAFDRAAAGAVMRVAAAAELIADLGVQLHGGMGVSDESRIAAQFRRLQAFRFRAGDVAAAARAVVRSGAHRRSAVLAEV